MRVTCPAHLILLKLILLLVLCGCTVLERTLAASHTGDSLIRLRHSL
jgi:hypothetical protein